MPLEGMMDTMTSFEPGPETTRAFRDALGAFTTGVTVVTTLSSKGPVGITANSFTSVSMDPPLVLWCPARTSKRYAAFEEGNGFAIHILDQIQSDVCEHFARTGFDFDAIDWVPGETGIPLIRGCLARFECAPHAVYDGGDHAIMVGRVTRVTAREGQPLVFRKGAYETLKPPG